MQEKKSAMEEYKTCFLYDGKNKENIETKKRLPSAETYAKINYLNQKDTFL